MNRPYHWIAVVVCIIPVCAQDSDDERIVPPIRRFAGSEAQVGGPSPFTAGCNGAQTGVNYLNAPVEPFLAADPNHPGHLVGVWQQDRWSNGGSSGLMAAVSIDRGRTWTASTAHFSICSGGAYERASDPWVSIAPDGTAHWAALSLNGAGAVTAVLVSRSTDGGFTWSEPITVDRDDKGGDDKESITADPTDAQYVYAIWDRSSSNHIPAWFSRSTDGGLTWEPARIIYDPGVNGYATVNQIVVLPDGTLVDVFALTFDPGGGRTAGVWVAVIRSSDHGLTWSAPIRVSTDQSIGTIDVKTHLGLRTGAGIPSTSVDRVSGAVYIAWPDSRFSSGLRDGIAFSKSSDGGLTWSAPVQVNQAPNVQAFTSTVAAADSGAVAVTYYDFRQDTDDPATLLANCWRVISRDGGMSWRETPVAGPFDMLSAPRANNAPFLGDYQGMAASGDVFVSFFVAANSGNAANPTSVFASSLDRPPDPRSNLRTEVNLFPRPMSHHDKPDPKRERLKHLEH